MAAKLVYLMAALKDALKVGLRVAKMADMLEFEMVSSKAER